MNNRVIQKFVKERDRVTKTYNVDAFKAFIRKWQKIGVYDWRIPIPPDNVIEISMRKMVYHMTSATEEERREAEQWLIEHGYTTKI